MIAGTSSMRKTVLVIECGAALHCRARISIPVAIPQKTRQSDDTAVLGRKWRRLFSRPGPLWRLRRPFPQFRSAAACVSLSPEPSPPAAAHGLPQFHRLVKVDQLLHITVPHPIWVSLRIREAACLFDHIPETVAV